MVKQCDQNRCGFHVSKGVNAAMHCPTCSNCGLGPNLVDATEICVACYNCRKDQGVLRGTVGGGIAIEIAEEDFEPIEEQEQKYEEEVSLQH